MGNPCTDPATMYASYVPWALERGLATASDAARISKLLPTCKLALAACNAFGDDDGICVAAANFCDGQIQDPVIQGTAFGNANYYNVKVGAGRGAVRRPQPSAAAHF